MGLSEFSGAAAAQRPMATFPSSIGINTSAVGISAAIGVVEFAGRALQAAAIHREAAGICRTIASYAAAGGQRKPPAKQPEPAFEATLAAGCAGLVSRVSRPASYGKRAGGALRPR